MPLVIENYDNAVKRINDATSPRSQNIARLRRYVDGTQYEGLPNWFDSDGPPLWNRAPCVVDPIVKNAIAQKVDLICGEGRYPNVTSAAAWDNLEEFNATSELDEGDSAEED